MHVSLNAQQFKDSKIEKDLTGFEIDFPIDHKHALHLALKYMKSLDTAFASIPSSPILLGCSKALCKSHTVLTDFMGH